MNLSTALRLDPHGTADMDRPDLTLADQLVHHGSADFEPLGDLGDRQQPPSVLDFAFHLYHLPLHLQDRSDRSLHEPDMSLTPA